MAIDLQDTIAAQASPSGPAERGILRISGADVVRVLSPLFRPENSETVWTEVRRPTRFEGHLNIPSLPVPLPASLNLWPTSGSYTGQPMAEIHTIGAPPLLDAVLEQLTENGVRLANRGEFTMRAFLAGRIDLVQAEAVLGVIDAADHEELQTALTQLGGGITSKLSDVRDQILSLLGDLEAGLDFVEEDIEFISAAQIIARLRVCEAVVAQLSDDSDSRLPSGSQKRVVLAGLPNAGKSTLFNRLIGSGKAIVSPIAGTTRDYLTSTVRFGQTDVELIDTAGWEAANDLIMQHAQDLRSEQIKACHLIVWCRAADLNESSTDRDLRAQAASSTARILDVVTRIDLADAGFEAATPETIAVCAETGDGLKTLAVAIERCIVNDQSSDTELLSTTAVRCRGALKRAGAAIQSAIAATEALTGDEVIAFELRDALHQIGVILGEVYTDDILDHIFSNFCIGK